MRTWQGLLLILFISAIAFANSLHERFIYGDYSYVYSNPLIRDPQNIPSFFLNPRLLLNDPNLRGHYRPVTISVHTLAYTLPPWSNRGVTLVFHIASAFLVFLIVKRMVGEEKAAFFPALTAGLIFAVHPFQTEVINFITARSSVVSGLFFLLSFYSWIRYRTSGSIFLYGGSLISYLVSMLSKEVAIVFPMLILLYDIYFPAPSHPIKSPSSSRVYRVWKYYAPHIPFILSAVLPYIGVRLLYFHSPLPPFKRDLWTQICTGLVSLVKYLTLFILPLQQSLLRKNEIYTSLMVPKVAASGVLLLGVLGITLWLGRSKGAFPRMVSFFSLWFFIVLAPTTIFPLNAVFQENRGYLALLLFAAAVSWLLAILSARSPRGVIVLLFVLIVGLTILTIHRNGDWRDPLGFVQKEAMLNPDSAFAFGELGREALIQHNHDLALAATRRAITLNPRLGGYLYLLMGDIYRERGENQEAIRYYEKGLAINPVAHRYFMELGLLYMDSGDMEKAKEMLSKAIRIEPNYYLYHYNLGLIYKSQGRLEKAASEYRLSLKGNPKHLPSIWGLASVLEALGRRSESIALYQSLGDEARRQGRDDMASEAGQRLETMRGTE